jgi:hypothetical protein
MTTTTPRKVLDTWAADWPDTITLGEAADEIGFDLFGYTPADPNGRWPEMAGDDEDLVLHKRLIPVDPRYSRSMLEQNDTEDFFGRIEDGLYSGGHHVPPVVDLSTEGLRDGNHRMVVAREMGLTHIPAYTDEDES